MRISDWSSDVCSSDLPKLVQSFGINVPLMITLTYCGGVGLAALAGVLAAPIYQVSPIMGSDLIIVVFAVVVIGRSEEHTSELQSLMRISYAVFCLKKKKVKLNRL